MNILNLINKNYLIDLPFNEIYPMTDENTNLILSSLDAEVENNSVSGIKIDGKIDDLFIIIDKDGKFVNLSKLKKIYNKLKANSISSFLMISPGYSKNCFDFAIEKNITIMSIDNFMSYEMKPTYNNRFGRDYNSKEHTNNITVNLRVPIEGYPELGIEGPPHAADIYKIIDMKLKPKKESNGLISKTINMFYESFVDLVGIINNGKNITLKDWNYIMNKRDVFEFLERNGSEIMEVIKS